MADAVSRARRATVLALIGGLLVANPLYVGLFVDESRSRVPTGYTSQVVDPTITPEAAMVIDRLGHDEVLPVSWFGERPTMGPLDYRYEEAEAAADVLREAIENGQATTDSEAVGFTLSRLDAHFQFVSSHDGETPAYHRFEVASRNGTTVVTAAETTETAVARYIVHDDARRYPALSQSQQRAIDQILEADDYGYRPYQDAGFEEIHDAVIVKDGTYYVFAESVHVDDFNFGGPALIGGVLTLVGLLLMVVAAVVSVRV